jgi:hypothetical protein
MASKPQPISEDGGETNGTSPLFAPHAHIHAHGLALGNAVYHTAAAVSFGSGTVEDGLTYLAQAKWSTD